jgi:segregation and condensation protein B
VELKEVASGFRYQIRTEVSPWVSRLWTERQTRYSRAQLETLALIAYRQPITRGEIENIRGVAVSSNIIKTLEEREWIRTVGHRDVPGKPELFGTTRAFLDYFNLKSLDELPPLAEIRDLSDFDPQLGLAPVTVATAADDDVDANRNAVADMATDETQAKSQAAHDIEEARHAAEASPPENAILEPETASATLDPQDAAIGPETIASTEPTETTPEHGPADEGETSLTVAAEPSATAPSEQNP